MRKRVPVHPLVHDLVREMQKQGLNKSSISLASGGSASLVSAWQGGHFTPTIVHFDEVAKVLGLKLALVPR